MRSPESFSSAGLSDAPLSLEVIADLIGAAPPPPVLPAFAAVISRLEEDLKKRHVVLVPGLVRRIVGGWLVGDVAVLVGPTGSGKTFLAMTLSASLESLIGADRFHTIFIEVTRDYDVAQFLGYENLGGEFTTGKFTRDVLFAGEPTDPRLVVMDEWNLAQIDAYFAPILSVLETKKPITLPGRVDLEKVANAEEVKRAQPEVTEGRCTLPGDVFFIATCNSWLEEPESRLPISGPVKRRCRIIQMPNLLDIRLRDAGNDGLAEVCNTVLSQERAAVKERTDSGRASIWDAHRAARLEGIPTFTALEEKTRQKLLQLSRVMLENDHTKNSFTVGLLRDILLSCVYSEPGHEYSALGQQVADKILHQVQGETKLLETLVELCKEFANIDELRGLARVMGAFSQEKRIRPLV